MRAGYAKIPEKITVCNGLVDKIMGIYAVLKVARKFGYNGKNLLGLNSRSGLPKPDFWQRWPRLLNNLS